MRILITGNLGFVGSATEKLFKESGLDVVGFDLMNRQDIRDIVQFEEAIKIAQPDRILHLAAIARFSDADKDPKLAHETNVLGTKNVAYVAAKYKIPLIYSSTGSVYMPIKRTPPITEDFEALGNSVYGVTKNLGELYVKHFGNPWMILRYAHLLGVDKRFHGLVGGFIDRIQRGLAPKLYNGAQSNDFTYITDVAKANYLAVTAPWDCWNNIYNIGTGEELTAEEAGKIICEIFGYQGNIEKLPAREVDPLRFVFDVSKAKNMLNFKSEVTFRNALIDIAKKMGVIYNIGNGEKPKQGYKKERI